MLARENRLTRSESFRLAVRSGRRAARRTLVVHQVLTAADGGETPLAGLVVGRAVGSAVTRNQVKRRLRHLLRERVASLPAGSLTVVRALPTAAAASSAVLGADLDHCLGRLRASAADDQEGRIRTGSPA